MDNMEPCGYPASDCHFAGQMDKHRDAIHELTQKLESALVELCKVKDELILMRAKAERAEAASEHWHDARKRAIEGGEILKAELESTKLQNGVLRDALSLAYDWMGRPEPDNYSGAHLNFSREQVEAALRSAGHPRFQEPGKGVKCPRCPYMMAEGGPCTKCGYVEKRVEPAKPTSMQGACQHEICDCESCKRRNDTRCRKCEWRA